MEYFPLGTLDRFMSHEIKERDAKVIASQLEGLTIMHEEGFAHRDLKPQNIFVVQKQPNWWVKIGDFGISKRVANDETALHTATGTPHYLAPEVSHYVDTGNEESDAYTNAVDIWSFACVIYQIMALQVPFPNYPRSLLLFCRGGPFPEAPLLMRTSPEGIEFIKSILVPLPTMRPRAQDLMLSAWLQIENDPPESFPNPGNQTPNDVPDAVKIGDLASGLSAVALQERAQPRFTGPHKVREFETRERTTQHSPIFSYFQERGLNNPRSPPPAPARSTSQTNSQKTEDTLRPPQYRLLNLLQPPFQASQARPQTQPKSSYEPSRYTQTSNPSPYAYSQPRSAAQVSNLPPSKPVFGLKLEYLYERDKSAVPMVVYQCIQAVDLFGLEIEGIYRSPGTASRAAQIKAIFDNDASKVDFRDPANFSHDVNSVAGVLKKFFRELPNPLLTDEHYRGFIEAAKHDDETVRRDSIHAIINALPDPHYATTRVLTLHLQRVIEKSSSNRMNASNLAIVFGSTLMRANSGTKVLDAGWQVRVVETFLQNAYQIFDD